MKLIRSLCLSAIFAVLPLGLANATIILSGDTNIGHGLDGSAGPGVDPGNQQFFSNILGGGTTVIIDGDTNMAGSVGIAQTAINNYYNGLGGVTSTVVNGGITAGHLAGANLLINPLPVDAYTGAEITAMSNFVTGGGTVFFLGENGNFPGENGRINAALGALGSTMSLLNTTFDSGFHTAVGGQIAAHPLTAGVATFTYAAPSQATVAGGTTLFSGTGGQPFVAVEGTTNPIPEATTVVSWALMGLTGLGLAWYRRRK